jgi:hypothetical protein
VEIILVRIAKAIQDARMQGFEVQLCHGISVDDDQLPVFLWYSITGEPVEAGNEIEPPKNNVAVANPDRPRIRLVKTNYKI